MAGEYDGQLRNSGEAITLYGPSGQGDSPLGQAVLKEPVLQETVLEYLDSWYRSTDGGGHSLVLKEDSALRQSLSTKSSWRASARAGGSPGGPDEAGVLGGYQLPGDMDQSQHLNLTDVVLLLGRLLGPTEGVLPCQGAALTGGNSALADVNGDVRADVSDAVYLLSYLVRHGPPPRGTDGCVRIAGCPDVCAQ